MKSSDKLEVVQTLVGDIKPYQNNPRHNDEAVDAVANSIREFGFQQPIVVDKDGVIIAGHTRYKAAKRLGLKTVPVVVADLTEEKANAYRLADNKTGELATWDFDALDIELGNIEMDMGDFGFDVDQPSWFDLKDKGEAREGEDEYQEFLEKFEAKHTTDDCYTPACVYNAVAEYVAATYKLKKDDFVRPFYPNGDYENEKYAKSAVVVDNPPFSILSEILRFYCDKGIKFFMFAPALTLFGSGRDLDVCYVSVGAPVTYENGAVVSTSFITNLDNAKIKSAPKLYKAVQKAADEYRKELKKELPKYSYPNEVATAPMVARLSKYDQEFVVMPNSCVRIPHLDAQKEEGKAIFGTGFLLSEKAAAEKAAAEKAAAEKAAATCWKLSERERNIIISLGGEQNG